MPEVELTLAEFKQLGKRNQRKPCGVVEALEAVPEKDRPRVLAAVESDDEDIRRGVTRWLEQRNIVPPTPTAATNHRRKRCGCHAR